MKRGYRPAMLLAPSGELLAIATGSDAAAEHEGGSQEMMQALTGVATQSAEAVSVALRTKRLTAVPQLATSRRITQQLNRISFAEGTADGQAVAALAFSAQGQLSALDCHELAFVSFCKPQDIAGAWCSSSFGFKVRGDEKVSRLRGFAQALRQGRCLFAGTFLADRGAIRLNGVIIAREDLLSAEHLAMLAQAQADYEAEIRLHLQARTQELRGLCGGLKNRSITHIWPVWANNTPDSAVLYAMNPGYNVDAPYWGPYGYEALKEWLEAGASTPLRPHTEGSVV